MKIAPSQNSQLPRRIRPRKRGDASADEARPRGRMRRREHHAEALFEGHVRPVMVCSTSTNSSGHGNHRTRSLCRRPRRCAHPRSMPEPPALRFAWRGRTCQYFDPLIRLETDAARRTLPTADRLFDRLRACRGGGCRTTCRKAGMRG